MRKIRRIALSLMLAVALLVAVPLAALAANPTVTITVNAALVSITNTQDTWNITALVGGVNVDDVVYFSADGNADVDYSQIENTGNVAASVEIQGEDLVQAAGGGYNWTLAAATGAMTYSLYAYNTSGADYTTEVKSSSYEDVISNLAASQNYNWSMKFTAPSSFNATDDGAAKTATVTLVATQA